MLLRIDRSHEGLLKRYMKFLPCSVTNVRDYAIVVEVDDDDVSDFVDAAEYVGIDVDEYDEPFQAGRRAINPEPMPQGGDVWQELI